MSFHSALANIVNRQDLSEDAITNIMYQIMSGELESSQIGALLVGLRMKGETVNEITTCAKVMMELANTVEIKHENLIDIVGTGGDNQNTFNISTISAIVASAAGACVAKHSNRSMTSKSGSADLLQTAGININLNASQIKQCLQQTNLGFMFTPHHHPALMHARATRQKLGIYTMFNLLCAICNPANTKRNVIGVYCKELVELTAKACRKLGHVHTLVVHSEDGLDEISLAATTLVSEIKLGEIYNYKIRPEDYGIESADLTGLKVENTEQSLDLIHSVLNNTASPALDVVLLNAGAGIYVSGIAKDITEGVNKARNVIANGAAKEKFETFISITQQIVA